LSFQPVRSQGRDAYVQALRGKPPHRAPIETAPLVCRPLVTGSLTSVPPLVGSAPLRPSFSMDARVDPDGCCEVRLAGEIDIATVEDLIALGLCCLRQSTVGRLVIALGDVTFIGAGGLGALVRLRKEGRALDKAVELTAVPAAVTRLLGITGLDSVFVLPAIARPADSTDRINGVSNSLGRPFFRGHGVLAIDLEEAGLVLWVKIGRGETITRFTLTDATMLRDGISDGPLRNELNEALDLCAGWDNPARPQ
jgi:anti-anti-sigma factor